MSERILLVALLSFSAAAATGCGRACLLNSPTCGTPFEGTSATARLQTFLCPDFNSGSCYGNSRVFVMDGQCAPINVYENDACYDTGLVVHAGTTYTIAACESCEGPCGTPVEFTTPAGFGSFTFDPGNVFFCEFSCSRPFECG